MTEKCFNNADMRNKTSNGIIMRKDVLTLFGGNYFNLEKGIRTHFEKESKNQIIKLKCYNSAFPKGIVTQIKGVITLVKT